MRQDQDQDGYAPVGSKILEIGLIFFFINVLELNAINVIMINQRMLKNV